MKLFSKKVFTLLFIIFFTIVILSYFFNSTNQNIVEGMSAASWFKHMSSKKSYGKK